MHIRRNNRHLDALRNLFKLSSQYIVLMENWNNHKFYDDILKLSQEPQFPWQNLFLYKKEDYQKTLMILSNSPIEGYKPLKSNKELLKYL